MTVEQFHDCYVPEPNSGCWLWISPSRSNYGYGSVWFRGKARNAQRVMWEISFGPIPAKMHVLHRCDMPPCVNPDHLFLGSHQDNMADMARKGRANACPERGEENPNNILTETQVRQIRDRYAQSATSYSALGREFGVSYATIRQIVRRVTWTHL